MRDLKEQIGILLRDNNGQEVPRESTPRSFSLEWTIGLPKGKGRSTAPVLEGISQGVEDFYRRVVEGIRPYVPKAPQLQKEESEKEDQTDVKLAKKSQKESEEPTTPQPVLESEESPQEDMFTDKEANSS